MERGDIFLVSLDPTQGHEQRGRRPVLVISPGPFNRLTRVPVVLPITTGGNFARTAGFAVSLADCGTRTTGIVRCDQPRASISPRGMAEDSNECPRPSSRKSWPGSRRSSSDNPDY